MTGSDNLTRDEARARAALLDDVAYDVHLDLTGEETFTSTTRATFTCEPGRETESFFDLDAVAVRRVVCNGRDLDPAEVFDGARVHLPNLEADNTVEIVADCAYQRTGVGLHRFVDPVDGAVYLHTQFEPFDAHRVYACADQPDIKARLTLSADAPAGWEVIANTVPDERPEPGSAGRWVFAETLPLPTYITALVAGPFHHVHDEHVIDGQHIPLGVYCRESLAPYLDADEIFEITKQGFDFFHDAFGYPYPFGKYDQLLVPEFNFGAMENAGCVTFSENYVFRSKVTEAARESRAGTILHELAHMWFGNLVTMRWWDDLWLNESFATYVGTLAVAEATRFTTAWADFAGSIKAWAVRQDQLPSTHPIAADMPDTASVRTNFDGITYAKGASTLRQLVAWVGRDAFFAGLRDYFARHEFGNAELADFLAALEAASGRDLADWSQRWLQTTGVATLRPELTIGAGERLEQVVLHQVPPSMHPTMRPHRLAVGLYDRTDGTLARRRRVELDVDGGQTTVEDLAGEPRPELLLVNDGDLTFAKVRLDDRSVNTLIEALNELPDPLARVLCWSAAWDMTRDAELPARRYVTLVARHAGAESELSTLQTAISQAEAAIDRYGDPANRTAARSELAAAAYAELRAAEPGTDAQLVWTRAYAANAQSDDELDWVRGLLEGEHEVDGVDVDTELRWHLLRSLAAAGACDEARIDAELSRDNTDMGARRAAAARAARPDAAAKEQAWSALLAGDDGPALATRRAIAGGFHQFGQEELLAGYVDRFDEALDAVWNGERMLEEAIALTAAVYPQTIVDQATLDVVTRALDRDESRLPAPGRRVIVEARDGTERALRARAADRVT